MGKKERNDSMTRKNKKASKAKNADEHKVHNDATNDEDQDKQNDEVKEIVTKEKKKVKEEKLVKLSKVESPISTENLETDSKPNAITTKEEASVPTDDDNIKKEEELSHFYSKEKFCNLPLSDKMQLALSKLQYIRMTHIQYQAIPAILTGQDVIGAAPTGSGKTLAFVVPTIDILHQTKFSNRNGTGIIIITPTRELALQIYGVIADICTSGNFTQTYGLIMGGANRRTEADKLCKGICIIVATPGRLLDHLQNTKGFIVRNLLCFIMDEADRILEQGFEDDLRAILKLLPKSTSSSANTNNLAITTATDDTGNGMPKQNVGRQTILFSATQTKRVQDLVRLSMNLEKSVFVDIPVMDITNKNSNQQQATAVGIEQGYVTCPSDQRFLLLFTFLKKNKKKKIMVFFSSCNSVKYHSELLNYIDIPVMDIHGRQKQVKRTTTFFQFCKNDTGTLLCTDVAARGLDIPHVDWIIQYDPPDDPKEYIHRVGRTARGASGTGRALLFLSPQEIGFLKYLRAANVSLSEYEFPVSKVANIQSQYQRLIESNYYLNRAARDAYRSYLLSYASHAHRTIFNVHELDLQAVAIAFGFTTPPRVDINFGKEKKTASANNNNHNSTTIIGKRKKGIAAMNANSKDDRKKQRIAASASGHAFSADNPYGKRPDNDKRQFTH
jgi:ATP-dependent RNA helicase DDX18/HAS1